MSRGGARSWLPRAGRPERLAEAPPWVPPGFARRRIAWAELSYIVVDELLGGVAGLVVSKWPRLDQRGRLRFPGERWRIGARVEELEALLAERRELPDTTTPSDDVLRRPLRIGDVFAARTERRRARAGVPELGRWLSPPVLDVSRDAREAAKTALFGAVAPVMSEEEAAGITAEWLAIEE